MLRIECVPPKDVEVLTPRICECDLFLAIGFFADVAVKIKCDIHKAGGARGKALL